MERGGEQHGRVALSPVGTRGVAVGEATRAVEAAAMAARLVVGEEALVPEGTMALVDATTGLQTAERGGEQHGPVKVAGKSTTVLPTVNQPIEMAQWT